jgi:chaperone BCS1
MGRVPARCIVLLEDLDAAFTRSVTRDNGSNGSPDSNNGSGSSGSEDNQPPPSHPRAQQAPQGAYFRCQHIKSERTPERA